MNVLILYCAPRYPIRAAIKEHLYAFERYAPFRCFYLNAIFTGIPALIRNVKFDLVIFHTTFLGERWGRSGFPRFAERFSGIRDWDARKIALPQDEFMNADLLCEFIDAFGIDAVYSVAPASEWKKIYGTVMGGKRSFHSVLTGYVDEDCVRKLERLGAGNLARRIDIGYRAYRALPWLGRHGMLKTQVADAFSGAAPGCGLAIDISNREEDTLLGDEWYRFLLRSKYTIGVEGGSSILDWDGSIMKRTEHFLAENPGASFEEVEGHCFPGVDGTLNLRAISPRHLEACATRTCQILVEGRYNGILKPWVHYIPLKKDFSNLGEILEIVRRDELRAGIVEAAHRDIIASGKYSYRNFVNHVVGTAMGERDASRNRRDSAGSGSSHMAMKGIDRLYRARGMANRLILDLFPKLPAWFLGNIRKAMSP